MLSCKDWQEKQEELQKQGVVLPAYDVDAARKRGSEQPLWIHFGAGNLFRAFHAEIADDLLDKGLLDRALVVAETFSPFIIEKVYQPYKNTILQVIMSGDGSKKLRILGSVARALFAHPRCEEDFSQMKTYFSSPDLQLASFTITEKGYALKDSSGQFLPPVARDLQGGPEQPESSMGIVAALLHSRFEAGAFPLALVSTDNFSQNGRHFREAILTIVRAWHKAGLVTEDFLSWVSDEDKVSFPWSMIDRITPNPSTEVESSLREQGFSDLSLIGEPGQSSFAAFANTEEAHYLVIEDSFPNGRPAFEKAGVIMTSRELAEKADTMKVTACLNPLHTCLAVLGCLLGYTRIFEEMKNPDLVALIRHLAFVEDLPVVDDPKVIDPQDFIDELLEKRLPNPSLPDAPQRIATDTSQKVAIRYGHTIASYLEQKKDLSSLEVIPFVLAAWLRYLVAVDDEGKPFEPSPDPLLDELRARLLGLELGVAEKEQVHAALEPILSNASIFGLDLSATCLAEKIEDYLVSMLKGSGAVSSAVRELVKSF